MMKTKQITLFASVLALMIGSAVSAVAAPGAKGGGERGANRGGENARQGQQRVRGGERDGENREDMQKRFEGLFEKVDADGSGEISTEELKSAHQARREEMKENGDGERKGKADRPAPTEEQIEQMKEKRKAHVLKAFKRADKDDSGELNKEEFRGFVKHMHMHKKHRGHGDRGKSGKGGGGGQAPIQD